MKRFVAIILVVIIVFSITGCSEGVHFDARPTYTYLDDGSSYHTSPDGQLIYNIETLPFATEVEGKKLPLDHVSFFELYVDHGYVAYVLTAFDRSNLSDDDIYWMTKYDTDKYGKTIDLNAYIRKDPNNYDSSDLDRLSLLGSKYDDKYIYYFYETELNRYSFMGSEVSLQLIVAPTGLLEKDTAYYYYDYMIDETTYSDSLEVFSVAEIEIFVNLLKDN